MALDSLLWSLAITALQTPYALRLQQIFLLVYSRDIGHLQFFKVFFFNSMKMDLFFIRALTYYGVSVSEHTSTLNNDCLEHKPQKKIYFYNIYKLI